jgi:hypothetical protein
MGMTDEKWLAGVVSRDLPAGLRQVRDDCEPRLIDSKTANVWADEVWCPSDEETNEEDDL